MSARLFVLERDTDISGVSGVGVVAEGIEFSDGVVALRWIVPPGNPGHGWPTSVVFHDRGIESVQAVHGHSGATHVVFVEDSDARSRALAEATEAVKALSKNQPKDLLPYPYLKLADVLAALAAVTGEVRDGDQPEPVAD